MHSLQSALRANVARAARRRRASRSARQLELLRALLLGARLEAPPTRAAAAGLRASFCDRHPARASCALVVLRVGVHRQQQRSAQLRRASAMATAANVLARLRRHFLGEGVRALLDLSHQDFGEFSSACRLPSARATPSSAPRVRVSSS